MTMPAVFLALAMSAHAQGAPAPAGAQAQLEAAAGGEAGPVFDGAAPRSEGPLTIVSEEKGVLLRRKFVPTHRECSNAFGEYSDGLTGPAHEPRPTCGTVQAHTVLTFGDKQVVRIDDREEFERQADSRGARNGALIGGLIGALGFLAALAGPVGWAVGAGCVIVGALIGAGIGSKIEKDKARDTPMVFDRSVNAHDVIVVP